MRNRLILFLLWLAGVLGLFAVPLSRLVRDSLHQGYSSHIVLIPLLASFLIWYRKEEVFASPSYALIKGTQFTALGLLSAVLSLVVNSTWDLAPLLTVLSVLLLIVSGFVAFFGTGALRRAAFPMGLLVLTMPVPGFLLDKLIYFLQSGSANLAAWMFSIQGVPVFRNGFVLTIPGFSIEVAKECSGINSSIALFIVMLIVAHETFHTTWRSLLFVLITIPLSILKNAMRIVTLTMLASRVDPGFLSGRLHHQGGFVFYLISLCLVYPIWKILQRTETSHDSAATPQSLLTSTPQTVVTPLHKAS